MGIKTYEYICDDGSKLSIRMNDDKAQSVGNNPILANNGIQPETVYESVNSKPIDCRYIWCLEDTEEMPTPGDTVPGKTKIIICDNKNDLFLNGGKINTTNRRYRITGAVGEKRIFLAD